MTQQTRQNATEPKEPNTWIEIIITVGIPAFIMMKMSGEARLGPLWGLVVALTFPLVYGIWDLIRRSKWNGFAILGLVSVLLTGGIGLLQLDVKYIAIKEAAIPAIIGIAVWVSQYTRFPIVQKLLLNPKVLDTEKLHKVLEEKGKRRDFEQSVNRAGYGIVAAFALSAVLNYVLAKMIVVSPTGTEAFTQELGKMTAISFPVIVLPSMIIMLGSIFYLFWQIKRHTEQSIENFIKE
ncbi:MAG: Intracellular septation protein A [Idiomarinaceae bacterium HL-53]|nr:MAG: Intracellular septation protein A [Idiomarinaceae bacterium HL-53]CUS48371.1 hypothetical protein Ga0003345_1318 [Idiomarinaceae bacterium HL-53]